MIASLLMRIKANQPYAGVFLRKAENAEDTGVAKNLDDIYSIGSFVKINETQMVGDKLHLIATAYRRIKVVDVKQRGFNKAKLFAELRKLNTSSAVKEAIEKAKKRENAAEIREEARSRRRKIPSVKIPTEEMTSDKPTDNAIIEIVTTENYQDGKVDRHAPEYKAMTLEIVKTIREIVQMNTLIRENLQQFLGENLKVIDNPCYMAYLAACITSAKPDELQQVMETQDVCFGSFFIIS